MKEQIKTFLKKLGLYHPLQSNYRATLDLIRRVKNKLTYNKYKGSGFTCNYCGAVYQRFVPHYPAADIAEAINSNKVIAGYGENVFCPNCMSKSRERLIKVAIDNFLEAVTYKQKKTLSALILYLAVAATKTSSLQFPCIFLHDFTATHPAFLLRIYLPVFS